MAIYEAQGDGIHLMTLAEDYEQAAARFRRVIDAAPEGTAPRGYFVGEAAVDTSRRCSWEFCYRECVGCRLASMARQGYAERGTELARS